MIMRRVKEEAAGCCCILGALTLTVVLVAAYAFADPVVVTIDEAALERLTLAAPAPGDNSTVSPSLLSFDLTLAVALRNHNWAMSAWLTAPPVGELRFRGVPVARGWLPQPPGAGRRGRIRARRAEVYRASAASDGVPVAVGSDAVAEFARESAAGVFELEFIVAGEVRYQAHLHRRRFKVNCPMKLALSTAMSTAPFTRVKCT